MQKLLALLLVLCAGCATLKPGKDGKTEVGYSGTASGAAQILAEQNRHLQTVQTGEVALRAIDKKMPVTLGQDTSRSDVQAGWTMPYGGMYGMYGANMYGYSPAIMAADAASLGYMPGSLPRLGEAPVLIQPQGGGSGSAIEQRLDRIEKDQTGLARIVLKRK